MIYGQGSMGGDGERNQAVSDFRKGMTMRIQNDTPTCRATYVTEKLVDLVILRIPPVTKYLALLMRMLRMDSIGDNRCILSKAGTPKSEFRVDYLCPSGEKHTMCASQTSNSGFPYRGEGVGLNDSRVLGRC
jgi:hypothetical protein